MGISSCLDHRWTGIAAHREQALRRGTKWGQLQCLRACQHEFQVIICQELGHMRDNARCKPVLGIRLSRRGYEHVVLVGRPGAD